MVLTDEELEEFNLKNPSHLGKRTYVRLSITGKTTRKKVMEELNKIQEGIDNGSIETKQIYPEDFD